MWIRPRRAAHGLLAVVAMVVALAVGVVAAAAVTLSADGSDPVSDDQAPARIGGSLRVVPGRTVVLSRPDAAFRDGTTTATFKLPRTGRPSLRLAADARGRSATGYRAVLRFTRQGPLLKVRRVGPQRTITIGRTLLRHRVDTWVRIDLETVGARVRARVWTSNTEPAWRISYVDARPLVRTGRARARVHVIRKARRSVALEGWLGYLPAGTPTDPPTDTPTDTPTDPPTDTPTDPPTDTPTDPPTDPPVGECPRLGVYNYWDPNLDSDIVRQFGAMPQVSASYVNQSERVRLREETDRIRRGTSPSITLTSWGTQYIAALGTGPSHPDYAEASAWLNRYVQDLSTLADVDPSVPVYATLEHEFDTKVYLGMVTGPSADPVMYGRALDRFYRLVESVNPRIRTTYWIIGYDRDSEGTVADQLTTLPDAVLFDPYAHNATDTLTSISTADLQWIRAQDWYVGQEIGLGEFGMRVRLGDAALARFYTGIRAEMRDLGISFGVFFNRERDFDTRIAERSDSRTFPSAQRAFGTALTEADVC